MDKKKLLSSMDPEELMGFEEFIESQPDESSFLPRSNGVTSKKTEAGFEHFTFLQNDAKRLSKLKVLLGETLPFSTDFDQSKKLIAQQREEIEIMRKRIFDLLDKPGSDYLRSLGELFDSYFDSTKS